MLIVSGMIKFQAFWRPASLSSSVAAETQPATFKQNITQQSEEKNQDFQKGENRGFRWILKLGKMKSQRERTERQKEEE